MSTPSSSTSVTFRAIGTDNQLVVTEPATLATATSIALVHLGELDRAASRFRADSEVRALARLAAARDATAPVSDLLADYLRAALRVARLTDGLVDPTVGAALVAQGYDDDLAIVQSRATTPLRPDVCVPGWRSIQLVGRQVSLTAGTLLDLGSSAKAHAADTIARLLTTSLPGGFLVNLGGDIATSGTLPAGGWQIMVESGGGAVSQIVTGHGQAIVTSSTGRRVWQTDGGERHHVIDPRTGQTATTPWASVTVAGASALEANAASTAAIVLGATAPGWLELHGLPARLDGRDGSLTTTCGWPVPEHSVPGQVAA